MAKQKKETGSRGYIVVKPFRDIANWDKAYEPGDDVSSFDDQRLQSLIERGLVEKQGAGTEVDEADLLAKKAEGAGATE